MKRNEEEFTLRMNFLKGVAFHLTEGAKVGYSKGVTEVYSDRLYAATMIGEGVINWLDQKKIQPKKVAILLLKQNLSLAIVDGKGNVTNQLILLDDSVELSRITQLVIDEVDNVLR